MTDGIPCPDCDGWASKVGETGVALIYRCPKKHTNAVKKPPEPVADPPSPATGGMSVEQLRQLARKKAGKCPACQRIMKVYKFRLGTYARLLIWMYQNERERDGYWLHIPDAPVPQVYNGGGDYAKLELFGLIERSPINEDPTKKSSGNWRLTDGGRSFVQGQTSEPSHFFYQPPLSENGALGFEEDRVTIQEVLGEAFNYTALMRGEW